MSFTKQDVKKVKEERFGRKVAKKLASLLLAASIFTTTSCATIISPFIGTKTPEGMLKSAACGLVADGIGVASIYSINSLPHEPGHKSTTAEKLQLYSGLAGSIVPAVGLLYCSLVVGDPKLSDKKYDPDAVRNWQNYQQWQQTPK
ncbi:MAG: hypothetical protein QXS93_02920 [Candidatus Micrarchaeia archaeon]